MRTENLAILLTDITGYTARTSAQTREEGRAYLLKHEAVVVPVIQGFGGVRRKNVGDAILSTFASPTNAVLAAMAVQDRLWKYNQQVREEDRLEIRAVLTLGEVAIEHDDVIGEAVAIGGKLEKLASGGDIVFTESLYLAMNKAEIPSREVGLRQLAGIPEPIRVYRVHRDDKVDVPPYGQKALAQLSSLPRMDDAWIQEVRRDPRGTLGRELSAIRRRDRSLGRWAAMALAPLLIAGAVMLWRAGQSPVTGIEASIERGELEQARTAITRYLSERPTRSADGHYLKGLIAIKEDRPAPAAKSFRKAIEEDQNTYRGHRKIRVAMTELLEHADCSIRIEAARTLGILGDPAARPALEQAIEKDRRESNIFSGLFCKFSDHARKALTQLE